MDWNEICLFRILHKNGFEPIIRDAQPPAFLPTPSNLFNGQQAKTLDDIEGCCDMQGLAAAFAEEFAALEEELARSTDDDNLAGDAISPQGWQAQRPQALFANPTIISPATLRPSK